MSDYLSRISSGRPAESGVAPSLRTRSPLAEHDQRLGLFGFPEAPPSVVSDVFPQVVPTETALPARAGERVEQGLRSNEIEVAPGETQASVVALEPAQRIAPAVPRSAGAETPHAEVVPPVSYADRAPPRQSRSLAEIVDSVARENAERGRSREVEREERARKDRLSEAFPLSPRAPDLEPAAGEPVLRDAAPRIVPRVPSLEIGTIHVEVVREAPRGSVPVAPVSRGPASRARSPAPGSPGLRTKLRFGLRQL